jgi:hypothetical protein
MFVIVPVYNSSGESEDRIIQTDHIEDVAPHADVTITSTSAVVPAVEVIFQSGTSIIVILDMFTMQARLQALTGVIDTFGTLT